MLRECRAWQSDRRDQLARLYHSLILRRFAGQKMEVIYRNISHSAWALYLHRGIERHHGDSHVRRMGGYALVASAEDCVDAVVAFHRRASRTGVALVACIVRIAEEIA